MQLESVLEFALIWLWLEAGYQFVVSIYGLGSVPTTRGLPPRKRFAIFIPAHNEEKVIAANVRSIKAMKYPRSLYEVFVVADHCLDRTAEYATQAGAIVLERNSGGASGKPLALNWAWQTVGDRMSSYDAVVIVDADNLVAPNFLSVMNNRLHHGERVIQANLDVKNPKSSWVSGSIALAYWMSQRTHQLARYKLGLCAALGGTGICIERELFVKLGWDSRCLTEDLDFQVRALQVGVRTTWAHETRIYDEKPSNLRASLRQRLRWMRGHNWVARRHAPSLIWKSVAQRAWICFDAALYLLQPLRVATGCVVIGTWIVWELVGNPDFRISSSLVMSFGVLYVLHLSQFLFWGFGLLALRKERVPANYYKYYGHTLFFGLTWLPVIFAALLRPRGGWTNTDHHSTVEIQERLEQKTTREAVVDGVNGPGHTTVRSLPDDFVAIQSKKHKACKPGTIETVDASPRAGKTGWKRWPGVVR